MIDNMLEAKNLKCCGFIEVTNLYYYYDQPSMDIAVDHLLRKLSRDRNWTYVLPGGAVVFTEAGSPSYLQHTYATRLAEYVEQNKLGTIQRITEFFNPNSDREVRGFVWIYDNEALRKWQEERGIPFNKIYGRD